MAKKVTRRAHHAAAQSTRKPSQVILAARYEDDEDEEEFYVDPEPDDDEQEESLLEDDDEQDDDEAAGVEEYTAEDYLAGQLLDLPSGKAVRVQPVSLLSMIQAGQVPNALLPAARKMVGLDTAPKGEKQRRMSDDTIKIMNFLICELVTSFKVVDKPQSECVKGEVSVTRMYEADKNAIVNFAMRGQRALRSFRDK